MSSTFVRSHEKLNQTFSETRSCFSHEEPKNMPGLSKSGPFNRKYVKHYYFILVLELSKTIGLNPRGYPGSLLNDFRDSEVVHEYEIFEKAMDTDENGIIGKSEFIGFKDYSKTSDELFNNGHEDTWLLTLKSPKGRGEYNVENLKLIRYHNKNCKTHPKGKKNIYRISALE